MKEISSITPLSFEAVDLAYGYMLYVTSIEGVHHADNILDLGKFGDRAIVYVDEVKNNTAIFNVLHGRYPFISIIFFALDKIVASVNKIN